MDIRESKDYQVILGCPDNLVTQESLEFLDIAEKQGSLVTQESRDIVEKVVTRVLKDYPVIAESLESAATPAYLASLVSWVSLAIQESQVIAESLEYLVTLVKVDSQELKEIRDTLGSRDIQELMEFLATQAYPVKVATLVSRVLQDTLDRRE